MSLLDDINTIARGCGIDFIGHALTPLERSPDPQHGRKSAIRGAHEGSPHVGLGTAEADSLPVIRYWTVKFERGGRTYYDHVEACDAWKAGLVVFKRKAGATSTQVVREIDREEYEHLTRAPA